MKQLNQSLFLKTMLLLFLVLSTRVVTAQCCQGGCNIIGNELITNGNFSNSTASVGSDHARDPDLSLPDRFEILPNPAHGNAAWMPCSDHGGGGFMMVVNGATTVNEAVWRSGTIQVAKNTRYCFIFHAANVNTTSPPELHVSFSSGASGGGLLDMAGVPTCEWRQLAVSWFSGNATSVNISIMNFNTDFGGNDFAIDDISFRSCTPIVTAKSRNDTSICIGSTLSMPVPSHPFTSNYRVISGDSSATGFSGTTVTPSVTTTYILTVTDPVTCCQAFDTVTITVRNCCKCPNTCLEPGSNRINNSTFSAGNTGFESNYSFTTGGGGAATYAVEDTAAEIRSSWNKFGNTGMFFMANGASQANVPAWRNRVKVTKGATYILCFDYINLDTSKIDNPIIDARINGVSLDTVIPSSHHPWRTRTVSWTANSDSARIEFFTRHTSLGGNDFGLDNIYFRQCKPSIADDTICDDELFEFPLPEDDELLWAFRELEGDMHSLSSGNIARPKTTTSYIMTVVNPATGCVMVDTITITVRHNCCPCENNSCYKRGPELIRNGDFSLGDTLFTSQYLPGNASQFGRYDVQSQSSPINGNWNKAGNPGNFFIGNGDTLANRFAWRTAVPVDPNSTYTFCFDVINLNQYNTVDPQIIVRINGQTILGPIAPDENDPWTRFSGSFNTMGANVADIQILSVDRTAGGNDFGLDNISFRKCTPKVKPVVRDDDTICLGSSYLLVSPIIPLNGSYFYHINPQDLSVWPPDPYIIKPRKTTTIVLEVRDSNGCAAFDTFKIVVKCCYCDIDYNPQNGNMIQNGDFNGGATGFTTNYNVGGSSSSSGYFWVQNNSGSIVGSGWNKSGNPGNFFFVNGHTSSSAYAWQQVVTGIQPNTDYSFCIDLVNLQSLSSTPNDPIIAIEINGVVLGTTMPDEADGWLPVSYTWNSGTSTTATIRIYSQSTQTTGNDFGIDNIGFKPCDEIEAPAGSGQNGTGVMSGVHTVQKVSIYPNPATSELTVEMSDSALKMQKVVITDISGKSVKTLTVRENTKSVTIPVSELSAGSYLITVYGADGIIAKRIFIKEKEQR